MSTIEARERLSVMVRQARGSMSQRAFAKEVGVSHNALMHWERGETWPDTESLIKLAPLLGHTLESLLQTVEGFEQKRPDMTQRVMRDIDCLPPGDLVKVISYSASRLASLAG